MAVVTAAASTPIVSVPPGVGYLAASLLGKLLGDVFLTRQEIAGLMQGLLCTNSAPAGTTKLTPADWAYTAMSVIKPVRPLSK
mgnify:CR=1 FL=1